MQKMLGIFDLKAGETPQDFHRAFADMARHLHAQRLLESWLYLTRSEHPGYDRSPPKQTHLVEMVFTSSNQARACWDYLEADPLHPLHRAMNRKVENTRFALYQAHVQDGTR